MREGEREGGQSHPSPPPGGSRPYQELLGQLLSDPLQQGAGGLLGAEQDQLHVPVSPKEEAFPQEADPHHAFQDPSRGAGTAVETNPQTRV